MKEISLEIHNLSYSYQGGEKALNRVSVAIGKGERIAVLGSNGAGKSTLFLNMNGVLTPDEGEIYYRDKKITRKELHELRRHVGIVFQDADNQIIASTVSQEVSFGPVNMKLSREEVRERVEEALEYMNITQLRERPPHYLSGGEKKRVSIADIIAMKPEIIIFDEPTASLDPVNTSMLEEVLGRLSDAEKTLIISTHDVDFAYRWAGRAIVFAEGSIIADDMPLAVFQDREIMRRANLKQPAVVRMHELLKRKGLLKTDGAPPANVEGFEQLL